MFVYVPVHLSRYAQGDPSHKMMDYYHEKYTNPDSQFIIHDYSRRFKCAVTSILL